MPAAAKLRFSLLCAGDCQHRECVTLRGGSLQDAVFPATFGVIQVEHELDGKTKTTTLLYDTGYSDHFRRVTEHYPERLYAELTPINLLGGGGAEEETASVCLGGLFVWSVSSQLY